jgi:putative acetyltransferase
MTVRDYHPADAAALIEIFCAAVHAIDDSVYTPEQKNAWAPLPADVKFWQQRLAAKRPFVAVVDSKVAGFLELEADGHIDCAYVHPAYQGQGIGTALLKHAIAIADERRLGHLYTEASKAARDFFSKHGFSITAENEVHRAGQGLTNYAMQRKLVS